MLIILIIVRFVVDELFLPTFGGNFLRPGQAVNSVRPETKFSLPCAPFPSLSSTLQRYEFFIAVYEYFADNFNFLNPES